jgi:hypothetical protein
MAEVGPEHTLAPEADLLGNALGRCVLRVGDELDALQSEVLERPPGEEP